MNTLALKRSITPLLLNIVAILVAIYLVGPILWVAIASFQGENELLTKPPHLIPQNPTLDNYQYVFTGKIPTAYDVKGMIRPRVSQEARLIAPAVVNSFIVATATMLISLVLGGLAAYTFSRLRFRFRGAAYNFILGSRLIPAMAVAIPYYVIVQTAGLLDTYGAMILVYSALALPFTIWFLTLYITNIPKEMEEAAMIDGCNRISALTKVVIPMAIPGIIAAAAFAFMTSYNEFLFARFLTQSIASQTAPVIIASIAGNPDASYSLISVCVTLALIPPLLLAIFMRRWLTEGLAASVTIR